MGNSIGKKRKMASAPAKKKKQQPGMEEAHLVSLTSSSLRNMTVQFPKEIEEDLERRKIESFKALAAGAKRPPGRSVSLSVNPADQLYEKMRTLDMPAMMVPKPWSEVDEILSKHKSALPKRETAATAAAVPQQPQQQQQPETIDMSELMEDLYEDDGDDKTGEDDASRSGRSDSAESVAPVEYAPKKVRALEKSVSFSTIHTLKELEGAAARPESVTSIMRSKNALDSSRKSGLPAGATQKANAAPAPVRKVKVNPRLLARVEAFS